MPEPFLEAIASHGTAVFLHGTGAAVGGAGLVYHCFKKQWGYAGLAFLITIFHGASAFHHNGERRRYALRAHTL